MRPIRAQVMIEVVEETSSSGLVCTEDTNAKTKKGKVISTGSGYIHEGKVVPLEVKAGEVVYFNSTQAVEIDGFKIVPESDIYVIMDEVE